MESGTADVPTGVRDDDLVGLYDADELFVTVWASTATPNEQSASEQAARWRSIHSQAEGMGVGAALLGKLEPYIAEAHAYGEGLVAVGAGDELLLVEDLAASPPGEVVRRSTLPSIVPVIKQRQTDRPHVVVLADRTGAELVSVGASGRSEVTSADDVIDHPVHKPRGQGMSHRRIQQRAENSWEHNARAVADEIAGAAARVGAELIVIAGDERATSTIGAELTDPLKTIVTYVDGGRHPDGSSDAVAADVETAVKTQAATQTARLLERYDEEQAKNPSVGDIDGVLAALAAAQVEVLLVHDDPDDDTPAWFDPDTLSVATDPNALSGLNGDPSPARLVDAAIRSAFRGGASVHVAPATTLPGGRLGAILRWD